MDSKHQEEKLARIRLNAVACMRSDWALGLIEFYGSAKEAVNKKAKDFLADGGVSLQTAEKIEADLAACDPHREMEAARVAGARVITALDAEYPALLRQISDPPLALFVRGALNECPSVALVGTRKPSDYGVRMAATLARGLTMAGIAIVSGLARGIDTVSHEAAVKSKGKTWAALGSGLSVIYPPENKKLAEKIVDSGGALVSEFPMSTAPLAANFPRRNRIISGLSYATVIVEGDFKSGSLITAKVALEQGREVLAVPGRAGEVMSRGPNMLIKNGAAPVEEVLDVLRVLPPEVLFGLLPLSNSKNKAVARDGQLEELSPDALAARTAIAAKEDGISIDALVFKTGWTVQRAAAALFELEAGSLITQCGGKYKPTV